MWRSAAAWCDLTSPVAYWSYGWDKLAPLIEADEIGKAARIARVGSSRRQAFGSISSQVSAFHGVFRHEWDHLRRLNCTTAGLLQHYVSAELVRTGLSLLEHCETLDCPFPLATAAVVRQRLSWKSVEELIAADHGQSNGVRDAHRAFALSALSTGIDSRCRGVQQQIWAEYAASQIPSIGVPYQLSDVNAVKLWSSQGALTLPGGRNLLEFFAVTEEISALSTLGAANIEDILKSISSHLDYLALFRWLAAIYPNLDFSRSGALRPEDLFGDAYRIAPIEFWAAADLALWIPFGPNGWIFDGEGCGASWEDIHPGGRWLKAVDALRHHGIDHCTTPVTDENRNERFIEVQDSLADALGWPRPTALARSWLAALQLEEWGRLPIFLGPLDEPSRGIMKSVLNHRIDQPFNASLNNINWAANKSLRFQCWIVEDRKELCFKVAGNDGDKARLGFLTRRGMGDLIFGTHNTLQLSAADRRTVVNAIGLVRNSPTPWPSQSLIADHFHL